MSIEMPASDLAAQNLVATSRYLRFPLSADHRAPLQDGSACPHCDARHVQKWGSFHGRQRYRCCVCRRTFSTFTGTALHYLKRPDRWRRFLWCVDGRLSTRSSAAVLGVNKDTALRWRHRLLDQWRSEPRPKLKGRVAVGDFCVPHSAKGSRSVALTRPARRRGEPWGFPSTQTGPVTVLVARESSTAMILETVGVRRLRSGDYDHHLVPRLGDVTEIVGSRGPLCPLAAFARRVRASYCAERRSFFPTEVAQVRRDLRLWLRPFRGVASRRLDNYMEWFRRRGMCHPWLPPVPTFPADRAGSWERREAGPLRDGNSASDGGSTRTRE